MLSGGTLSKRKVDLADQKIPAVGFIKTRFAHRAAAGDTQINLASMTIPPEMTANGFTNPSSAQIAAANLLFWQNNLKLVSSVRGYLVNNYNYRLNSSSVISFIGFTALEGEIFEGIIDYTAQNGQRFVDASSNPVTGVLAAGTQTIAVGGPWQTNKYGTTQIGILLVYLDGILQTRNTGNSSTTLDGNYYEVDNGSGNFSSIQMNYADPTNARNYLIVPNGLLTERPDGSMIAIIESLSGQIANMSTYVAALAGTTQNTILAGNPTYPDLSSFGASVIALQNNRARIDQSNTWTAYQQLLGLTTGSAVAAGSPGQIIQSIITTPVNSASSNSYNTIGSISVPPGIWLLTGLVSETRNTATGTHYSYVGGGFSTTTNSAPNVGTPIALPTYANDGGTNATIQDTWVQATFGCAPALFITATTQTIFLIGLSTPYSGGVPTFIGEVTAVRIA